MLLPCSIVLVYECAHSDPVLSHGREFLCFSPMRWMDLQYQRTLRCSSLVSAGRGNRPAAVRSVTRMPVFMTAHWSFLQRDFTSERVALAMASLQEPASCHSKPLRILLMSAVGTVSATSYSQYVRGDREVMTYPRGCQVSLRKASSCSGRYHNRGVVPRRHRLQLRACWSGRRDPSRT